MSPSFDLVFMLGIYHFEKPQAYLNHGRIGMAGMTAVG